MSSKKEKWLLIKLLFASLAITKLIKKENWSLIKEMLFAYLAISKIMYWVNTINSVNQNGLGDVREAVVIRLLNRDLILIVSVIFFYYLDSRIHLKKSKYNKILEYITLYSIGFIFLIGIILFYNWLLSSPIPIESWPTFIINFAPSYFAIVVVFEIKHHFKSKAKLKNASSMGSIDDKLSMLEILREDDVLTQEEFDQKKDRLHGM